MHGSPWLGVLIGLAFTSLALFEMRSGKAYSEYSTVLRRDSPVSYWFFVAITLALGLFALFVASRALLRLR
jgi:hypothetical protein